MSRPRKKDRHLPPCVYPKHGAFWLVKRGVWTRLGSTLKEALDAYAERHEASNGTDRGMGKLIDDALPLITRGKAAATQRQYTIAAARLKRMLIEFAPHQVKPRDVAGIKRALASTPNFANRCLSVLRLVFNYAVEEQLVDANPCIGIQRHEERKRTRLITWEEYWAIHAQAVPRLQCFMELLYRTGQRPIDVLNLRRADLRADGIYFRQQKTDEPVIVPWTPELKAAVERAKALHGNVTALTLFHTRRGGPPARRTVYDQWVRACERAGVQDADMRDLRALAATEAKKQGKNATDLLGHASPAMTQRYLRGKEPRVAEGPEIRQVLDERAKSS